jgi:hypothetical protein
MLFSIQSIPYLTTPPPQNPLQNQVLRALLKCPAPTIAATIDERLTADVLHTGKTALMLAAFKHFTQGVKLLLEEGGACIRLPSALLCIRVCGRPSIEARRSLTHTPIHPLRSFNKTRRQSVYH